MILYILFNTQVDVPIRIHNGDTAIVTFTGVGYDKRVMGETMQLTADQLETSGVPSKTCLLCNLFEDVPFHLKKQFPCR